MACNSIDSVQIALDKSTCEVRWKDGHVSRFHAKWLRYNCRCQNCKPPVSGVYTIDVGAFPEDLSLREATASDNGSELRTSYNGEIISSHAVRHPTDWLRAKCYCDQCLERKIRQRDVITRSIADPKRERIVRQLQYTSLDSDEGLYRMLENVVETGLCLIKEVPTGDNHVSKVSRMVGYVESTTFGEQFDVFAEKLSENASNTDLKLPLHQDQIYYENGPGIQMLHAVAFDKCVSGGDSKFVDLFEAVAILRRESPDDFQTMLEVPVTHFATDPRMDRFFEHQKPVVNVDYFGEIVGINWHPATTGVPQVRERDVERYYKAHRAMLQVVRRKELQFRFKLEQGDLIVFNNRRMLHAREAYQTNGGNRHLQGLYMKLDDWRSKYVALAAKLGKDVEPPKMANNSSF